MTFLLIIVIIILLIICARLISIIDHLIGIIVILGIVIAIFAFKGSFQTNQNDITVPTASYQTESNINDATLSQDKTLNESTDDIDHYVEEYVYANVDDSLILRNGPSTDYQQIGTIQNGEQMYAYYAVVNFRGYCWYYVDYNGTKGYVLAKYTTK